MRLRFRERVRSVLRRLRPSLRMVLSLLDPQEIITMNPLFPLIIIVAICIAFIGVFSFSPAVCSQDAKICSDGSGVARVPPFCEFASCPSQPAACDQDVSRCPDGSYVARIPPQCHFAPCPSPELAASLCTRAQQYSRSVSSGGATVNKCLSGASVLYRYAEGGGYTVLTEYYDPAGTKIGESLFSDVPSPAINRPCLYGGTECSAFTCGQTLCSFAGQRQ